MSAVMSGINRGSTRTVRKVEAPRPLKTSLAETKIKPSISSVSLCGYHIDSVDKLVTVMDMVISAILQDNVARNPSGECESSLLTSNIAHLCNHLKIFGTQLENSIYQGQLDHACLVFRDAMVRGSLEYAARVNLLEILELRERSWTSQIALSEKSSFNSSNLESDGFIELTDTKSSVRQYQLGAGGETGAIFGSDEVLRRSIKHRDKTSKMASKNYCKDEIVIRNSDSGKVMGIKGRRVHMIEQLSDTIISFQRVAPVAKERLVQITGANEDNILYATRLIGNTIRSNSSPIRELSESDSASSSEESLPDHSATESFSASVYENYDCEQRVKSSIGKKSKTHSNSNIQPYLFRHKVLVSNCRLTITGDDYTYVTVAKAVLDDYFSKLRQSEIGIQDVNNDEVFINEPVTNTHTNLKRASTNGVLEADSFYSSPLVTTEKICDLSVTSFVASKDGSGSSIDFESVVELAAPSRCVSEPMLFSQLPATIDDNNAMSNMDDLVNAKYMFKDGDESEWQDQVELDYNSNSDNVPKAFTKEFLLECRNNELSQQSPKNWEVLAAKFPGIVKDLENMKDIIDTIIIE